VAEHLDALDEAVTFRLEVLLHCDVLVRMRRQLRH